MSSRILCVNCGICVNRLVRHVVSEQDTRVVSFIIGRISPQIITEYDYMCQACLDAIMMRVNQVIHEESKDTSDNQLLGSSDTHIVGHSKVCKMCGKSLLRRKSALILHSNPSELQEMIAKMFMNLIRSQELTTEARICYSCRLKAKRYVLRMRQAEEQERISASLPLKIKVKEESQVETEGPEWSPSSMEQREGTDIVDLPEQASGDTETVGLKLNVSVTSSQSVVKPYYVCAQVLNKT